MMEVAVSPAERAAGNHVLDRLAAGFLLILMAVGSLVLWIGVPAGCLYLAGQWTDTAHEHFLVALPMTLGAMMLFGWLLFWINGIYMGVAAVIRAGSELEDDEEDELEERPVYRGPLELFLVVSLVIALVALCIWFFLFAENPPRLVI
jgi:hypothetical protein